MDFNAILAHYRESQDAFWQAWGFLCRSYLLLRKFNPLLGDSIAVLGGIVVLLASLEVFALASKLFSEKYVAAVCNLQKGICRILKWLFRHIQIILKQLATLWGVLRKLKKNSLNNLPETIAPVIPVQSQTVDRIQLAIESRALLLEVLSLDARHRVEMRRLLQEADKKLQLLGCSTQDCLITKAMTQSKGTTIKLYAQSILEMSSL